MTVDWGKRRRRLSHPKLRLYDGHLTETFGDRDHALTREGLFVAIIRRHMTKELWRELFWHQPRKVVLGGREFGSLCAACELGLACLPRKHLYEFECVVEARNLTPCEGRRR